jgi:NAD(P)-dependent dehydrogenase (short-subunit alcohol dehydrogenase family)
VATIVMTGGTSGLGQVAANRLLATPSTRLLLGARRPGPPAAETIPLDLAYLDNVRSFAAAVGGRLDAIPIDALVLNAGRSGDAAGRTADGFETTFVVNHLAHYLLLRLLLPRLADHARIVLTTSGTHDPAQRAPLPPPRHADAQLLAHPELDPDRDRQPRTASGRAYTASKLCVVLAARALAAQPEARARQFTVVAYDPGRTPAPGCCVTTGRCPMPSGSCWDHRCCGRWCRAPTAARRPAAPWPSWPWAGRIRRQAAPTRRYAGISSPGPTPRSWRAATI